jgi:hypothetical protein
VSDFPFDSYVPDPNISFRLRLTSSYQDLTYALALLTSLPHTSPAQLTGHFTRITSLLTLAPLPPSSFTPSPSLLAIFATGSSAPLPTTQPIREIQAVSIGEAWSSLGQFVKDVQGGLDLWDGWTKGIGWAGIRVSVIQTEKWEETDEFHCRSTMYRWEGRL